MSLLKVLFLLFIGPLKLFFEAVFNVANNHVSNPGFAIILLSVVVNIAVFPLYHRADIIQKKERDLYSKLKPQLDFINKHFKGDERYMVIQTFYRQNNYSPLHALNGTIPLLLQIPFFIAAYQMLSNLDLLNGVSFGPIKDLGAADNMFIIGGIVINVLPIIMTLINLISGAIYTKGAPLKEKIQLCVMALLFLVLLYNSPSGLAFYWTLNNFFSLMKNVITEIVSKKNIKLPDMDKLKIFSVIPESGKKESAIFVFSGFVLAVMTGLYIPSDIVSSSPIEFCDPLLLDNSIKYVWYAFACAIGLYLVWASVIYYLASSKTRSILSILFSSFSAFSIYSFFGNASFRNAINANMNYNMGFHFKYEISKVAIDILILLLILLIVFAFYKYKKTFLVMLLCILLIPLLILSTTNVSKIYKSYSEFNAPESTKMNITLSREGQNVVILMLDREISCLFEKELEAHPELMQILDGFTYYPNTLSYGKHTNIAAPALFGGYEYTPQRLNERADESLEEKHNEALSVLPVLFSENGYDVAAIDLPYLGYQEITDTSVLNQYEGVNCFYTGVIYTDESIVKLALESRERNLFCFSLFLTSPLCIRDSIYDCGRFNNPDSADYINQNLISDIEADGIPYFAQINYDVLASLTESTTINDGVGSLVVMQNGIAHEQAIYDATDWSISDNILNTSDAFSAYSENSYVLMSYYHSNYVGFEVLNEWFEYLRSEGVYDNTRIIIVSDHGFEIRGTYEEQLLQVLNPILLVKDFNSTGFTISEELMTNADTAYLAVNGVIDNPVNPFTGNLITNEDKYNGPIVVCNYWNYSIARVNGSTFADEDGWYLVSDDCRDLNNWQYVPTLGDL